MSRVTSPIAAGDASGHGLVAARKADRLRVNLEEDVSARGVRSALRPPSPAGASRPRRRCARLGPFLRAAAEGAERVVELGTELITTLRLAMFCVGARSLEQLQARPRLVRDGSAASRC